MKCKSALLSIIIALIFIGSELVITASVSAPEEEGEKTFGDSNRDEDYSVQQTKDGSQDSDFMWGLVAYHIPFECYTLRSADFRRIAENDVEWLSVDFAWILIEPKNDAYNFSYYDFVVEEANRSGLGIVAKIGNGYNGERATAPEWTKTLGEDEYVAEVSEYAKKVVNRYKDSIHKYSIENEANIYDLHKLVDWRVGDWSDEKVVKIWKGLSQAIRSVDPTAEIILSLSISGDWENWLQRALSEVDFDTVGIQPYPCILCPDPGRAEDAAEDITTTQSYGKDVVVLETGYHTYRRTEKNQARYIEIMSRTTFEAGAKGVFFYEYLDGHDEPQRQERHFGLLENNREPKIAWTRYGEVIRSYNGGVNS